MTGVAITTTKNADALRLENVWPKGIDIAIN